MKAATDKARQVLQETDQDRKTRSTGDFAGVEATLPLISSKNIPLLDSISSYLGCHNPFAGIARPDHESVWLFDNTAYRPSQGYRHRTQPWQADFVAAYFKKDSGKDISKLVAAIADKIGLTNEVEESRVPAEKTIAERLQPFVDAIAPARWVKVTLPTGVVHRLGPGGRSAVSVTTLAHLGERKDGDTDTITAVPSSLTPLGPTTTYFAGPEGWTVISDIDDSVKITMTPSPNGILQSTFVDSPTPIRGMPAFYKHIADQLSPNWFYLSASPYNLYPFLRSFLRNHYPPGPIILRDASWMDLGGFLASLTQGTEAYKEDRIRKIHSWLPTRKVICVGDSTQTDPETYATLCREFPGWIQKVFIRRVTDVAETNKCGKNDPDRFEKAFARVDRAVWTVFDEPEELYDEINRLKSRKRGAELANGK